MICETDYDLCKQYKFLANSWENVLFELLVCYVLCQTVWHFIGWRGEHRNRILAILLHNFSHCVEVDLDQSGLRQTNFRSSQSMVLKWQNQSGSGTTKSEPSKCT